MIKRIAHVCILARDLGAAEWFYCTALGLTKKFEFRRGGDVIGFYLDAGGGTFIEIFRGEPAGGDSWVRHFCLEVDDIDAVKRRLDEHGVATGEKICPCDHAWQFWCKDPSGMEIEFHQYTERSLQLTGGVAELSD